MLLTCNFLWAENWKTCSIGCLALYGRNFLTKRAQKCPISRAQNQSLDNWMSYVSIWHDKFALIHITWILPHSPSLHRITFWWSCINQSWTPCMEADDIHDTAALLGQKHLSIMHPHEKTWKQTYTLEVLGHILGHACLLYMYMAYIFSSLYHMTMPILDLRWHMLAHKNLKHIFLGTQETSRKSWIEQK